MAGGEGFSGKVVGLARVRKQEKDKKGGDAVAHREAGERFSGLGEASMVANRR